jgi:hypothetical protein
VPSRYLETVLEEGVDKEDILFCKRFAKSFRMGENNFNLLYSKLGWYGCHYLVPDDRLLGLQVVGLERVGEERLHWKMVKLARCTRALFGRAVLPQPSSEPRPLNLDIIKEGILTNCESRPLPSHFSDLNVYSSASRLLCYCLDNFNLPSSMQFMEFYHKIGQQLPLLSYLSYQPKQFYYLPSFTFQVFAAHASSTATILICEKGPEFITAFSAQETAEIEERASWVGKLPLEMEFGYVDRKMLFDEFLHLLRLNILRKAAEGERKGRSKRWPNSLVSPAVAIPNYELRCFYEVMSETKQIVQFEFKQLSKPPEPIAYADFALIHNRWQEVHSLAQLQTSAQTYFYCLSPADRKKYIVESSRFIRANDTPCRTIPLSEDIANSMEVISYELSKMFAQ